MSNLYNILGVFILWEIVGVTAVIDIFATVTKPSLSLGQAYIARFAKILCIDEL